MSHSAASRSLASATASAERRPSTSSRSRRSSTSATDRCPECGAAGAATSAACELRFQALGTERFDDSELASDWRLIVDCYSLQHERYVRSGRSLAAHLTGVYVALEHGGDESILRAVQQWLSRTRELARPEPPISRGDVTVHDVIVAAPEERHGIVRRWAVSDWAAWAQHHELARRWIAEARSG